MELSLKLKERIYDEKRKFLIIWLEEVEPNDLMGVLANFQKQESKKEKIHADDLEALKAAKS